VDMMDNASALPTCPQRQNKSRQLMEIGQNLPTRSRDEALFLIASGLRLYLDRFTWLRWRSGGDDEIPLGRIYFALHYLTDRSD
jgi:hypothetical protein